MSLQRSQGRLIAAIAVALWAASAGVLTLARAFEPVDLAKDKPWRASSTWPGALPAGIFFHTLDDDSPWVEIDLGKPTTFSKLTIINRKDAGMQARAVPLVIEVSDDQQAWREITRTDEVFDTWAPKLQPVTARFVRARAARKTWLHLEALRVYP